MQAAHIQPRGSKPLGGKECWTQWVTTLFSHQGGSSISHKCSLKTGHLVDKIKNGRVVSEGTDHLCVCGHSSIDGRGGG